MKQHVAAACAALMLVAGPVMAEEATTASAEKAPAAAEKATTGSATEDRAAKMKAILKDAGASEEQITKYMDLQKQQMEAREGGDREKARSLREEQGKILTEEQNTKVREKMREMFPRGGGRGEGRGQAPAEGAKKE